MVKIQVRRGLEANLPTFDEGEPGFTTDTKRAFFGSDKGNVELAKKEDMDQIAEQANGLVEQLATNSELDLLANTIEPKFDGFIPAQNANRWFQSFCYIAKDNAILVGYCDNSGTEGPVDIVKFSLLDYSIIQVYTGLTLYHINDMTYNPNTNEIIVATLSDPSGTNRLAVLDYDTMTLKQTVSVNGVTSAATIAYEKEKDEYITYVTGGIAILDASFVQTSFISLTKYDGFTLQCCEYIDGLIYIYFNHLIWVYDRNGTRLREWYIPVHNEGEGIAYVGNGDFLIGQISPSAYQYNPRLLRFNMHEEFNSANWVTVSSLSDLGRVEGQETIPLICDSMSDKSKFIFVKESTNLSTAYPSSVGVLEIVKYSDNRQFLKFYNEAGESWQGFYNKSNGTPFSGWVKVGNSSPIVSSADLNTITSPGRYYVYGTNANVPEANSGYLTVEVYNSSYLRQVFEPSYQTGNHFYSRNLGNGVWGTWQGFYPQLQGSGSPEGVVSGRVGNLYTDTLNGKLYFKKSGTGNTGWQALT